ncbi:putative protein phosphatase 2C 25 [Prunus yedoensis var. nudiflora]|uniref:protein-serine/threonine phosphatase n=1 Tax=Prunus yedoensis var. nudiflora TaxID=2094558 RepID=A0A314ZB69_PRUYE|nr:putative protein phosphatase 2C 25 [Prunus yedoensis var. nudiflora]
MSCALVVPNSPIFSPSKIPSIFFRSSSLSSPSSCSSPRVLHGPLPTPSRSSSSTAPLESRFQRHEISGCKTEPSGLALKRKRPMMIDIPVAPLSFKVESPDGAERVDVVEVEEDDYSVYCKRGRRGPMEDRYSAVVDLRDDSRQAFFGVFDGHGGATKAAEFAAKNMDRNIKDRLTCGSEEKIVEAVKDGYLTTDVDFLKENVGGGACCVTALMQKGNLVVSNAGDCRAVMSRGGVAEALTSDHHPSRIDERARIETTGGYVDCCRGQETTILRINPECEFLVLASDGLWDKVTNQEAVDVVRPLCVGTDKPELFSACKKLVDLSIGRGSMDDTSVMIIQLGRFVS